MRAMIEAYVGVWVILVLFLLGMSFTLINMNVIQARKIFSDVKAEVQASNGQIIAEGAAVNGYKSGDANSIILDSALMNKDSQGNAIPEITLKNYGYHYEYKVTRQSVTDRDKHASDETYIYNDLYKISMKYEYSVPLFGRQVYPMTGFAY